MATVPMATASSQTHPLPADLIKKIDDALAEHDTDLKGRLKLIEDVDRRLQAIPPDTGEVEEIRFKVRFLEALTNLRLNNLQACESQVVSLQTIVNPQLYPELAFRCRSLHAAVMLLNGQDAEGLKALEELLAMDTSKVAAYLVDRARVNHAHALEVNGRLDDAIAQYQSLILNAIQGGNDSIAIQAGNNLLSILLAYRDQHTARQVLAELDPIVARNSESFGALAIQMQRIDLQSMSGQDAVAEEGIRQLLARPNLPPMLSGRAHATLAAALERKGVLDEALEHATIAVEKLGKVPAERISCQILLARLLLKQGDHAGVSKQLAIEYVGRLPPALATQIYQLKLESQLLQSGRHEEVAWVRELMQAADDREDRIQSGIARDFEKQLALIKQAAREQQLLALNEAASQSVRLKWYGVYFSVGVLASFGLFATGLVVVQLRRRAERIKLEEQLALNARLESLVEAKTTELKANLAAQSELSQALERKKRIETVGLLAGNVAHDINNLLQVIANANQTLADHTSSEQMRLDALLVSDQSLRHGAGIVGQILAYSRQQELSAKSISVGEFLSSSRPLFQSAIGATIALTIEDASQSARILIDASQLTTALLNLLSNAADAMPEGGTIHIQALLKVRAEGELPHLPPGEYVCLTVKDTGTGFLPEDLARAFEPFFSTKQVGDGAGLGLSSVKAFIQRSGGDVRIESVRGAGTSVHIWLPHHKSPDPSPAQSPPTKSDTLQGKRLLLVEDHPGVAQSISILLKQIPLEVVWVPSGDEASEKLNQDCRFDFVLSDVRMPGTLDGVQLARWIESNFPHLPVTLMSGYSDLPVNEMKLPFLQKPFKLDDLMVILREMARRQ